MATSFPGTHIDTCYFKINVILEITQWSFKVYKAKKEKRINERKHTHTHIKQCKIKIRYETKKAYFATWTCFSVRKKTLELKIVKILAN